MMSTRLSRRDLEALSAYLDGQLPPRQQADLKARLAKDAKLAEALEELRATRAALRNAPQLQAPRNFTLTPEMAGVRPAAGSLFGAMRLVSAVASILLVVVLLGDVFSASMLPRAFSPLLAQDARYEQPAAELAPLMAAEEGPAELGVEEEGVAEEMAEGLAASPAEEEASASEQAVAEAEAAEAQMAAAPDERLMEEGAEEQADSAQPEAEAEFAATATETPKLTPTVADEAAEEEAFSLAGEAEGVVEERGYGIPWLRALEGTLALLAVSSGLIAFILHRRGMK